MTVRIVTDSACDLPPAIAAEHGIEIVPLSINFGDETLIDREQLGVEEFWSRLARTKDIPGTAAPAPGRFEEAYRRLIADGATGIVVVSLSGNLSATIQSAELASRSVTEVPIEVVDSKSATLGVGLAAIAAARLAATGADTAAVAESVRSQIGRAHV